MLNKKSIVTFQPLQRNMCNCWDDRLVTPARLVSCVGDVRLLRLPNCQHYVMIRVMKSSIIYKPLLMPDHRYSINDDSSHANDHSHRYDSMKAMSACS